MPYFEPSRPMPLSFIPPKGAISVEMRPSLMPTMPYSRASATRQMRPMRWPEPLILAGCELCTHQSDKSHPWLKGVPST
jgi:hypothetical protein